MTHEKLIEQLRDPDLPDADRWEKCQQAAKALEKAGQDLFSCKESWESLQKICLLVERRAERAEQQLAAARAREERHCVADKMPKPHARYRVYRDDMEPFDATPCYGMHSPWWVPRNAFTKEESDPISMEKADCWSTLAAPAPEPCAACNGQGCMDDSGAECPVCGGSGKEPAPDVSEPHPYNPSYQHMGDCKVCGRLQDDPIHQERGE